MISDCLRCKKLIQDDLAWFCRTLLMVAAFEICVLLVCTCRCPWRAATLRDVFIISSIGHFRFPGSKPAPSSWRAVLALSPPFKPCKSSNFFPKVDWNLYPHISVCRTQNIRVAKMIICIARATCNSSLHRNCLTYEAGAWDIYGSCGLWWQAKWSKLAAKVLLQPAVWGSISPNVSCFQRS